MKLAPIIINLDHDILADASASLTTEASLTALEALVQALNDVPKDSYPPFTKLLREIARIFKTTYADERCLKLQLQIDGTFFPETKKFQIDFSFLASGRS